MPKQHPHQFDPGDFGPYKPERVPAAVMFILAAMLSIAAAFALSGCAFATRTVGMEDPSVQMVRALTEVLKAQAEAQKLPTPPPAATPTPTPALCFDAAANPITCSSEAGK